MRVTVDTIHAWLLKSPCFNNPVPDTGPFYMLYVNQITDDIFKTIVYGLSLNVEYSEPNYSGWSKIDSHNYLLFYDPLSQVFQLDFRPQQFISRSSFERLIDLMKLLNEITSMRVCFSIESSYEPYFYYETGLEVDSDWEG